MIRPENGLLPRLALAGVFGLALVCLGGCGKSKGEVRGKVTFKKDGTPVSVGSLVTFWGSDNRKATTETGKDGEYLMPDAPLGEVTVTVTVPSAAAQALTNTRPPGDKGENPVKPVIPIPAKYADPKTSPVKTTIQKGSQEFNIPIE